VLTDLNAKQTTPKLITEIMLPIWSWINSADPHGSSSGGNKYIQNDSTKPWLDSGGSWEPTTDSPSGSVTTDSYVELDLSKDSTVIGLVLQGRNNEIEYVKKIKVTTSTDKIIYAFVDSGNEFNIEYTPWDSLDNTSIQVPLMFSNSVIARYVRIYPTAYYTKPAMRVGVMVQDKPYHPGMKQGLTTSILKGLLMQGNKNIPPDDSTEAIKEVIPDSGKDVTNGSPFKQIRGFGLQ